MNTKKFYGFLTLVFAYLFILNISIAIYSTITDRYLLWIILGLVILMSLSIGVTGYIFFHIKHIKEYIIGVRLWHVEIVNTDKKNFVILKSLVRSLWWKPGDVMKRDNSLHGVYAFKNNAINKDIFGLCYGCTLIGEVYLWGSVKEYTNGYQADKAYPKNFLGYVCYLCRKYVYNIDSGVVYRDVANGSIFSCCKNCNINFSYINRYNKFISINLDILVNQINFAYNLE